MIEAVFENLEVKKKVFAGLDKNAPPHAILASNTSGLSITEMAAATKSPEKVAGMHFFNPVAVMKLAVCALARKLGKELVLCKDVSLTPFLVMQNRNLRLTKFLMAYTSTN